MRRTIIMIVFIAATSIGLTLTDHTLAQDAGRKSRVSALQSQPRSLKEAEKSLDEEFKQRMTQIAAQRLLVDRFIKEDKYDSPRRRHLSRVAIGKYD